MCCPALLQLVAEERSKDSQTVGHRKEAVPEAIEVELPEDAQFMMRLRLELVSGINFDADWIFCEYQVLLPTGWRPEHTHGWMRNDHGEWTLSGSTHVSRSKELRSTSGKDPMLAYVQQQTDSASGVMPQVAMLCAAWTIGE